METPKKDGELIGKIFNEKLNEIMTLCKPLDSIADARAVVRKTDKVLHALAECTTLVLPSFSSKDEQGDVAVKILDLIISLHHEHNKKKDLPDEKPKKA